MDISLIVEGHVNEVLKRNTKLNLQRLEICKLCPLFSSKLGGVCNSKLYLNPKTNDVSLEPKEGYFKGCSCRLNAKTRLPNAKCPAGKW